MATSRSSAYMQCTYKRPPSWVTSTTRVPGVSVMALANTVIWTGLRWATG